MIPSNCDNEIGNLIAIYGLDNDALTAFSKSIFNIKTLDDLFGDRSKDYIASIVSIPYTPTSSLLSSEVSYLEYGTNTSANVFTSPHLAKHMKTRYVLMFQTSIEGYQLLNELGSPTYTSFQPYSQWNLYLPFYGYLPIDPNFVIKNNSYTGILIQYNTDLVTGDCLITVSTYSIASSNRQIIAEVSCSVGKRIEMASIDNSAYLRNATTSAIGIGAGLAIGGGAAVGSAISAGVNALLPTVGVQTVGQMTGGTAIFTSDQVFIRITQGTTISDQTYINEKGCPSASHIKINALAGYNEFSEIHLDGVTATESELNEIEGILKSGFIV